MLSVDYKITHRIWCFVIVASIATLGLPCVAQPVYEFERIVSKLHHGLYAYIDARGMDQKVFIRDPEGWEEDPMTLPVKPMPEDIAQELRDAQIVEWSRMTPLPAPQGANAASGAAGTATNGSMYMPPPPQSSGGCSGCGPAGKAINALANVASGAKKGVKKMGSNLAPAARGVMQVAVPLVVLGGAAYLASRSGGFGTAGGANGYNSYPKTWLVQYNYESNIYHHPMCPHAAQCTVHCLQITLNEARVRGTSCKVCNGGNG